MSFYIYKRELSIISGRWCHPIKVIWRHCEIVWGYVINNSLWRLQHVLIFYDQHWKTLRKDFFQNMYIQNVRKYSLITSSRLCSLTLIEISFMSNLFVLSLLDRVFLFVSLMFQINKHKADNQLFRSNFPRIFHYILLTSNAVIKSFYCFFEKKIISHCQLFHSDLKSKFLEAKSAVK